MEHVSPAGLIVSGVERTLELAQTWLAWNGVGRVSEDGERIYTPHKAIRRYCDHLIDHLAQIEALVAGEEGEPDEWHGSLVTLACDWASFSEADLNEARQRLRRLGRIYLMRFESLGPEAWDAPRGGEWTLREIVEHVAPPWYAEQVGDLREESRGRSRGLLVFGE